MKIHQESAYGLYYVRRYGTGFVTVNAEDYRSSLIVMTNRLIRDWPPQTFGDLSIDHFVIIADLKPEVALLGTGRKLRFPDSALTSPLIDAQIGLEIMDTAAACRTYNILAGEGRKVAAALLLIED